MSGKNAEQHRDESVFKSDCMRYMQELYPTAHVVLIPATHWRLLPYDWYVFYNGTFRAIELKVDDNPLMAHQMKALFEVAANRGYAFSMRWSNSNKTIEIQNYTLGTTEFIKPVPSERQVIGNSKLDIDDRPATRKATIVKALRYIMSFEVTPLEAEIQHVVKENYKRLLEKVSGAGSRTKW